MSKQQQSSSENNHIGEFQLLPTLTIQCDNSPHSPDCIQELRRKRNEHTQRRIIHKIDSLHEQFKYMRLSNRRDQREIIRTLRREAVHDDPEPVDGLVAIQDQIIQLQESMIMIQETVSGLTKIVHGEHRVAQNCIRIHKTHETEIQELQKLLKGLVCSAHHTEDKKKPKQSDK